MLVISLPHLEHSAVITCRRDRQRSSPGIHDIAASKVPIEAHASSSRMLRFEMHSCAQHDTASFNGPHNLSWKGVCPTTPEANSESGTDAASLAKRPWLSSVCQFMWWQCLV